MATALPERSSKSLVSGRAEQNAFQLKTNVVYKVLEVVAKLQEELKKKDEV